MGTDGVTQLYQPGMRAGRLSMPIIAVPSGIGMGGHPVDAFLSAWVRPWMWGLPRRTELFFVCESMLVCFFDVRLCFLLFLRSPSVPCGRI